MQVSTTTWHCLHTAILVADDYGTGEPAQDAELLSCPRAELLEIERCASQRMTCHPQFFVKLYRKRPTEHTMRPSRTIRSLNGST